jgi:hypothetical protein
LIIGIKVLTNAFHVQRENYIKPGRGFIIELSRPCNYLRCPPQGFSFFIPLKQLGQVSLMRRAGRGLQMQAQYMWSHNIGDNGGAGDGQNIMISIGQCDRGDADWDVRHTFSLSAVYDLPYGKGRPIQPGNAVLDALFGGWNFR